MEDDGHLHNLKPTPAVERPAAEGQHWRVGDNVPWGVAWSDERAFRLQPSKVFPGQIELAQIERPRLGTPSFAGVHVTRHQRAMAGFLCHVCGRPTEPGDRHIFPAVSGGFVPMGDGRRLYGGNVPPVHGACAEAARRLCPHLRRHKAEAAACPADVPRLIPRTDVPPGMEALAKTLPPGRPVVLSCYHLYDADFSRRIERLLA